MRYPRGFHPYPVTGLTADSIAANAAAQRAAQKAAEAAEMQRRLEEERRRGSADVIIARRRAEEQAQRQAEGRACPPCPPCPAPVPGLPNNAAPFRQRSVFTAPFPSYAMTATGYTPPAATYDKMRQMHNASAEPLERDVQQNVASPDYRAAWDNWYHHAWLPFYQKYAGPDASVLTKFGANLYSDEVAARAEAFRQQLEHFYRTYPQQRTFSGQAVPRASGAPPILGGIPAGSGWSLPWWVWGLGLAAVGGVGLIAYYRVKELRAKRKVLEEEVLPKYIGKDLAKAAAARDGGSR